MNSSKEAIASQLHQTENLEGVTQRNVNHIAWNTRFTSTSSSKVTTQNRDRIDRSGPIGRIARQMVSAVGTGEAPVNRERD